MIVSSIIATKRNMMRGDSCQNRTWLSETETRTTKFVIHIDAPIKRVASTAAEPAFQQSFFCEVYISKMYVIFAVTTLCERED